MSNSMKAMPVVTARRRAKPSLYLIDGTYEEAVR
jgi:hypothetical protein